MIQYSLFTHYKSIGKHFQLKNGNLFTFTNGEIENADVNLIELNDISEFPDFVKSTNGFQHITIGISGNPSDICVPKNKTHEIPNSISRSDDCFKYSKQSSLMIIDCDNVNSAVVYYQLLHAIPELCDVACVSMSSSSSNIYDSSGNMLRGETGTHIVFAVDKGKEIPRVLDVMHKRMILAGYDNSRVSGCGGFLERSAIDKMVSNPSHPIYLHANLSDGLYQKKRIDYIKGNTRILEISKIPNLTLAEENAYLDIVSKKREELSDEMRIKREQWINQQPDRRSANTALEHKILDGNFMLDTIVGKIAVRELNPEKHNNITCRDPFDPKHITQAKLFYNENGQWVVNSFAHGGCVYLCLNAEDAGFTAQTGGGQVIQSEQKPSIIYNDSGNVSFSLDVPVPIDKFNPVYLVDDKKPLSHYENFLEIMSFYGVKLSYNEITHKIIYDGLQSFTDDDNINDSIIEDQCRFVKMPVSSVQAYISRYAFENRFNPVEIFVKKRKWDKSKDYIREMFETLNVISDDDSIEYELFKKWCCGAVRIALRMTQKFHFVMVLQNQQGGDGKSTWFERLVPSDDLFSACSLSTERKDDLIKSTSKWIVELGELDSIFRKSEVKALMQFLDNRYDEIRKPYERKATWQPRRTAFCGTVNNPNYLVDDSGDRRFWTFKVGAVKYDHDVDIQQFWAQVYEQLACDPDFNHWLNREENAAIIKRNLEFKKKSGVEDLLEAYFDRQPMSVDATEIVNCGMIAKKIGLSGNVSRTTLNAISNWMKHHGFKKAKSKFVTGYRIPVYPDLR